MNTKVIFNIDANLKTLAMWKAKKDGMTLSAFLNIATRAYTNDTISVSAFDRNLAQARDEVKKGKSLTQEQVYKKLGLPLRV